MDMSVDELGPVDWLVIEFPGKQPTGEIAPHLVDLVDRGLVRVLDLLVLQKDSDGTLSVSEIWNWTPGDLGEIRATEAQLAMVLSEQDVLDLAATIEPGSTAAVLVWENLWAAPFGTAKPVANSWPPDASPPRRCWPRSRLRRGRSWTCPWLTGAGAGGLPLWAEPSLSLTATTAGQTGATTGAMTVATGVTSRSMIE